MSFEISVSGLKIGRRSLSGPMSLGVPGGEIHVLSGPNGCGKSLLLDAAVGVGPARGLSVKLGSSILDGSSPTSRWRRGLRRMFQAPLFPGNVTASEAMFHAGLGRRDDGGRHGGSWNFLRAAGVDGEKRLGQLSFSQRRAVELCVALNASGAALLDEPFSGIAAGIVPQASELIRRAAVGQRAILVVEHLRKSDRLPYDREHQWVSPVESSGADGNSEEPPPGLESCARRWHGSEGAGWTVQSVRLGSRAIMESCSIAIGPGQFVIVGGANGSGKSTLLRALAGVPQPWQDVTEEIKRDRQASRFHFSPQPPKLLADLRVRDNMRYMLLPALGAAGEQLKAAREILCWIGLREEGAWNRWAGDLSGGEAAMVALAGATLSDRPVLLLDEPFEGLSRAVQARALRLLACTLALGKSAVVSTHDPDLLARAGPGATISLGAPEPASGFLTGAPFEVLAPP